MLKKRLIGVVTVKNGWAVQSFGYRRHLPLGRPEVLVQNLDRWGADEILVQCIDRSSSGLGPDLEVLGKISKLGIATPLIYAGGIGGREDAVKVVSHGADRIMVDAMVWDLPQGVEAIARDLGTQAVIAHLPVRMGEDGLKALDYRNRVERPIASWLDLLPLEWVSELMVTDWSHEGIPASFDERLLAVTQLLDKPLLCFGGISKAVQLQRVLAHPEVVAAGVGNFLSYQEHAVQTLKKQLGSSAVRTPHYDNTL
ncbi:MAG TPA: HisA/HisF-related TIM barrel protein [Limnobacter sp.]|uniref:HisA/HisF-related TIM barrel protein n=1 Tax=Limnobacter sp. TaxID=2003368 RepID=UPI002EDA29ED